MATFLGRKKALPMVEWGFPRWAMRPSWYLWVFKVPKNDEMGADLSRIRAEEPPNAPKDSEMRHLKHVIG
ncbi:hypothetical protein [Bifidobacterium choerinum]|uniref:hypothetical protein n=1 Tax=Bifidobacterium choerinum TaxID=35760 RepID=UPI003F93716E